MTITVGHLWRFTLHAESLARVTLPVVPLTMEQATGEDALVTERRVRQEVEADRIRWEKELLYTQMGRC